MSELTEERLAEIEERGTEDPYFETAALVAEVRRLREVENEREEARGLAREFLYILTSGYPYDVTNEDLNKDLASHPWLVEPEPATATGVAEAVFGMHEIAPE